MDGWTDDLAGLFLPCWFYDSQLLLALRLPVLGWMFKGRVLCTHTATAAMWTKWVALTPMSLNRKPQMPRNTGNDHGLFQRQRVWNINRGGREVCLTAPLYNKVPENEKQYALFTNGSCCTVGKHRRWKTTIWSPTYRPTTDCRKHWRRRWIKPICRREASARFRYAKQERWAVFYLCTASRMVANAPAGMATAMEAEQLSAHRETRLGCCTVDRYSYLNIVVNMCHVDTHKLKSWATEENQNNQLVDWACRTEVAQLNLDRQRITFSSVSQARRKACDWGVDMSTRALLHLLSINVKHTLQLSKQNG